MYSKANLVPDNQINPFEENDIVRLFSQTREMTVLKYQYEAGQEKAMVICQWFKPLKGGGKRFYIDKFPEDSLVLIRKAKGN